MLNLFRKKSEDDSNTYSEAVILEIPLESGEELGTSDEHNAIFNLENVLSSTVKSDEIMDGHDFGEETAIIYLYGPSADRLYENIEKVLKKSVFNRFEVTLRYGYAEDPEAKEKHFTLSW